MNKKYVNQNKIFDIRLLGIQLLNREGKRQTRTPRTQACKQINHLSTVSMQETNTSTQNTQAC